MNMIDPGRLHVTYSPPASIFAPIDHRRYTMTHSDSTGELFVTIGCEYDVSAINPYMRDEVLTEWVREDGQYRLNGRVYISGGEFDRQMAQVRYMIFKREMGTALAAIVNGDAGFFTYHPWLLDAPITIHFESVFPEYDQMVYFGTPRQYVWQSEHKDS